MRYLIAFLMLFGITACSSTSKTSRPTATNPCKVLVPELQNSYTGSCKRGLADGKGKAAGIDRYEGSFKKGLPDGKGTYHWANGAVYKGTWSGGKRDGFGIYEYIQNGQKVTQQGYWENDRFTGNKRPQPDYTIIRKRNIERVSIVHTSKTGNNIQLIFKRNGSDSKSLITNLMLLGSSGALRNDLFSSFVGFDKVNFPFTGKISYNISNAMNSYTLNSELEFKLNKPGNWQISIDN